MATSARRWRQTSQHLQEQLRDRVEMIGDGDIITVLHVLDDICGLASELRTAAVKEARAQTATWEEIGDALGQSRQAVWEKYKSAVGEQTSPPNLTRFNVNGGGGEAHG